MTGVQTCALPICSDAHQSAHIAAAFPQAVELIAALGFRYLSVYRSRTPLFCKIDS